jgi:hypothetical protein
MLLPAKAKQETKVSAAPNKNLFCMFDFSSG